MTLPEVILPVVDVGRGRMRDRAVVRGIGATAANRVISAGASLVTLGLATRSLSKEEFGFVATVVSIWMILTLLDLGLGATLSTRVAAAHGRDDPDEMQAHIRDALHALAALGLLVAVAGSTSAFVLPWGRWLGGGLSSASVAPAVVVMFVTAGMTMPGVVGVSTLIGRQRLATAQFTGAAASVATIAVAAGAAAFNLPMWTFVVAILGCPAAVTVAVTVWILIDLPRSRSQMRFSAARIAATMRVSGYFAIINASSAVTLGAGTLIVASIRGPGDAAVFSVASRVFGVVFAVIAGSGVQLWPALTEALGRDDVAWARARYRHGVIVVTLASFGASSVIVAVGRPLTRIWVGSSLVPSFSVLISLGLLTTIVCGAGQIAVLPLAAERVRPLAIVCIVNAVLGAGASVALTHAIGQAGAAVGGAISSLCILVPGVVLIARSTLHSRSFGETRSSSAFDPHPATKPAGRHSLRR